LTNEEVIALYVQKYGKGAKNVINWLAKEQHFVDAISTELGQQVMSAHTDRAAKCFDAYHSALATEDDISKLSMETVMARAEYNVCLKIIADVQARINKYNKTRI
ncbi:hypothetical protein KAR91_60505, partial [Candidatus Pacearchaeota archaeon]|nr:hypothetical protein [Candidatus Pacearchaeota archaeon]